MLGRVARPNTLVLQCPPEVASMSEHDFMVELFKSVPQASIRACQFLPKNYVRVTFKDEASRDAVLVKGVSIRGVSLNVFEADPSATLVYCYWIPVEVSTDSVRHALSSYGQVLDCYRQVHPDFPEIESGVRLVRIKLTSQIPDVIRILNFPSKIYYRGQPQSCRSCRKIGHLAKDCLLKGRCLRCGSPDHLVKNCTNAWNASTVAPPAPGPDPPAPRPDPLAPGPDPPAPRPDPPDPGLDPPVSVVSAVSSDVPPASPVVPLVPASADPSVPVSDVPMPDSPASASSGSSTVRPQLSAAGLLADLPSDPKRLSSVQQRAIKQILSSKTGKKPRR